VEGSRNGTFIRTSIMGELRETSKSLILPSLKCLDIESLIVDLEYEYASFGETVEDTIILKKEN
jgi:hypothetical protein